MTLTMCCNIVFEKNERRNEITLIRVNKIEVESSWKEMTSRGSITLPRNVKFFDKYKVREVFRRGDPVTVSFGYDGVLIKEFEGYVSEVSADIPIVIQLEDEMFKVRRIAVNFSHANISLKDLLVKIVPGYKVDCLEGVQLGSVRLPNTQVGPVLEKLKEEWGLYSYMKGKTLMVGKYYADDSDHPKVLFHLERNVVSTSLNYKKKEDVSLRIKVVSTLREGTKVEVDGIGDPEGNERVLTFYNISSESELKKLGQIEYEKYKQDRFEGSFTAFGKPSIKHGWKVNLMSTLYEERTGIYYVEKTAKTFDINGIRQEITLGDRYTVNQK